MARQGLGLIGPAPKQRHPFALQQAQRGLWFRDFFGHQGGIGQQCGEHTTAEATHPEKRHRRYSRVSESMQRLAKPAETAPSALPCEWMTPLGGPLLPEVNMMTIGSLGVTVAASASTIAEVDSRALGSAN